MHALHYSVRDDERRLRRDLLTPVGDSPEAGAYSVLDQPTNPAVNNTDSEDPEHSDSIVTLVSPKDGNK